MARSRRGDYRRSEAGDWEYIAAEPAPELRELVRGYAGFVETSPRPMRRRELPGPYVPLIISFGAPYEVGVPGERPVFHRDSFIARVSNLPATTSFTGRATGVQVDLSPLCAHMFVGLAMDELPAPAVGLTELLGAEGRRLTEMLEDAPDWESRFDLLDAAIGRRLARARAPKPSVQWAWRALEASGGAAEIGSLSERLGCSPRHLITGFREQVGVTPKTAARIVRLERAAAMLRERRGATLARVAADCGYHDQAHMTRDFRDLAMTTPSVYAAAWQPGFLGVPEERVNSVQDGGGSPA
jgi:AraC-like DNA-binding protein